MSEEENTPPASLPAFAAGMRASDADRERVATELRDHAVAGRLDTDELEDRLQQAYGARTTDELQSLRRDLPATPEQLALAHRERRGQLVRRTVQETGGSLGAFGVCTAIWALSGASSFFWPLFVALGVIGLLVRNLWDLYGPGADLDSAEARLEAHRSHKHDHAHRDARPRQRRDRRFDR
jgi:hypothetical protein